MPSPSSRSVRKTRTAISPRFATRTFANTTAYSLRTMSLRRSADPRPRRVGARSWSSCSRSTSRTTTTGRPPSSASRCRPTGSTGGSRAAPAGPRRSARCSTRSPTRCSCSRRSSCCSTRTCSPPGWWRRSSRRELLISGLRLAALERGVVIAARDLGKLKTWSQAIAAAVGGLAAAGVWSDTSRGGALLVAVVLTWVSGLDYARVGAERPARAGGRTVLSRDAPPVPPAARPRRVRSRRCPSASRNQRRSTRARAALRDRSAGGRDAESRRALSRAARPGSDLAARRVAVHGGDARCLRERHAPGRATERRARVARSSPATRRAARRRRPARAAARSPARRTSGWRRVGLDRHRRSLARAVAHRAGRRAPARPPGAHPAGRSRSRSTIGAASRRCRRRPLSPGRVAGAARAARRDAPGRTAQIRDRRPQHGLLRDSTLADFRPQDRADARSALGDRARAESAPAAGRVPSTRSRHAVVSIDGRRSTSSLVDALGLPATAPASSSTRASRRAARGRSARALRHARPSPRLPRPAAARSMPADQRRASEPLPATRRRRGAERGLLGIAQDRLASQRRRRGLRAAADQPTDSERRRSACRPPRSVPSTLAASPQLAAARAISRLLRAAAASPPWQRASSPRPSRTSATPTSGRAPAARTRLRLLGLRLARSTSCTEYPGERRPRRHASGRTTMAMSGEVPRRDRIGAAKLEPARRPLLREGPALEAAGDRPRGHLPRRRLVHPRLRRRRRACRPSTGIAPPSRGPGGRSPRSRSNRPAPPRPPSTAGCCRACAAAAARAS